MDPVEWAFMSAQAHNQTLGKLHELSVKLASEQSHIAKLNAQLEDFIKTKNETEAAMLEHFMTLLNEKKRKIRDQNRLLAAVEVDQSVGKSGVSEAMLHLGLTPLKQTKYSRREKKTSRVKLAHRGRPSARHLYEAQWLRPKKSPTLTKWRLIRARLRSKKTMSRSQNP